MVPAVIEAGLSRVRRRRCRVELGWGAGRFAAVAAGALAAACLLDWVVDLRTETPPALRAAMTAGQLLLWGFLAGRWLLAPLLGRPGDDATALWIEERFPELDHRLISAVQLNRPGAPVEGMSAELIAAATRQAEEMAGRLDFAGRVDAARLARGAALAAAAAFVAAAAWAAAPRTVSALLARQLLLEREIPRAVHLTALRPQLVWPVGEELALLFNAEPGAPREGRLRIEPPGRPAQDVALTAVGPGLYRALVPGATADFAYRAWLGDGRLRRPGQVRYEPRPVVQKIEGFVVLPAYAGLRPDGSRYEQPAAEGEIAGPSGSGARVAIALQKPIVRGRLVLTGRTPPGGGEAPDLGERPLAIAPDGRRAEVAFELTAEAAGYRLEVADRHGFANLPPPRRGLGIVPDEPPRVELLPERFAADPETRLSELSEVEGMPVPLGSAVRIAYYAAHPYGLGRARLAYRRIKAGTPPGEEPGPDEGWTRLPLGEVRRTDASGPFDPRLGIFANSGFRDQVEFHPLPSPDPARVPGRTEGGGRFDFPTSAIPGLEAGDQIDLVVEVLAANPALADRPGRSAIRRKAVVRHADFVDWILQTLRQESAIRELEAGQRRVFTPTGRRD